MDIAFSMESIRKGSTAHGFRLASEGYCLNDSRVCLLQGLRRVWNQPSHAHVISQGIPVEAVHRSRCDFTLSWGDRRRFRA